MTESTAPGTTTAKTAPLPLTWRLLRLHHVRPNGWQRALVNEGVWSLAAILTLADVATAWTLVVLPAVALAILKAHDVLVGWLPGRRQPAPLPPPRPADFAWHAAFLAFVLVGFLLPSIHDVVGYLVLAAAVVAVVVTIVGVRRQPHVQQTEPPAEAGPALADQLAPYESVTMSATMTAHMKTAPDPEGSDAAEEVEELSRS